MTEGQRFIARYALITVIFCAAVGAFFLFEG